MQEATQLPVLVAGAGPTGLTAAMELQRMGVPVRLVDRAAGPSTTSRALAVQARTVELMAQRGLGESMLRLGNRAQRTTLYADGKQMMQIDLHRIPGRYNFILLLSQGETERLLREHLQEAGVAVEFQTELIAFAQRGAEHAIAASQSAAREGYGAPAHEQPKAGGVTATLRKPDGSLEEVEAAYLVCAEGAHSNVRETLGFPFLGKSLENSYLLGDLYLQGNAPENELTIFLAEAGLLAVFPMGGGRFRMIATVREAVTPGAPDPTLEDLQKAWDRAASIPVKLHDLQWSSRFRINSRMVDHLQQGRIFLAGDSAHIHSPAGGQGMNTGIQDSINLCWKLAMVYHGVADAKLLDTYEGERLPVIRGVVRTTETVTDAAQSQNRWLHQLITHVAPFAMDFAAVQNNAARILSQTGTSYEKGPLAHADGMSGELLAGDRVPDAEMAPGVWLHQAMDPSRFSLLSDDPAVPVAVPERWVKRVPVPATVLRGTFGEGVRLALVRPDGYLAWSGDAGSASGMQQWLREWFRFETGQ